MHLYLGVFLYRKQLCHRISEQVRATPKADVDLVPWLSATALELIGVGGMGYSFNALAHGKPQHEYVSGIKLLGYVESSGRTVKASNLIAGHSTASQASPS